VQEGDERLFKRINNNSSHVLRELLPPPSTATQQYNLRRRPHDRQMPDHTRHMADKNFLTRMLFEDSYWLFSIVIVYSQVSAYAFCHVLIKKWLIDCKEKINKAYSMLGLIKRNFIYLTFVTLYKSLVRCDLEYANSIWNTHRQGLIKDLEKVQMRATKLVLTVKHLTYKERLLQWNCQHWNTHVQEVIWSKFLKY